MNTKILSSLLFLPLLLVFTLIGCTDLSSTDLSSTDLSSVDQPQAAPASGSVTMLSENGNRILLETERDNQALLQIFSEQGLGSADISITNSPYPAQITLRLNLRGLEELTIRHADDVHRLSISSIETTTGRNAIQQSTTDTNGERSLTPDAKEWLAVELVDTQAQAASLQPTIPLEDGYINVTLPQSFIDQQIREFTIQWVDFYR